MAEVQETSVFSDLGRMFSCVNHGADRKEVTE